jgi:hypothetical protein
MVQQRQRIGLLFARRTARFPAPLSQISMGSVSSARTYRRNKKTAGAWYCAGGTGSLGEFFKQLSFTQDV